MNNEKNPGYFHESDSFKKRAGDGEGFDPKNPPHPTAPYICGPENTPRQAPPSEPGALEKVTAESDPRPYCGKCGKQKDYLIPCNCDSRIVERLLKAGQRANEITEERVSRILGNPPTPQSGL